VPEDLRSDEELVQEATSVAGGVAEPFEVLVARHQGSILSNCRYLTRSPADAEDLAQEVFVRAYFALPRFEGRSAFKTWLRKIKVNHCLNFIARGKNRVFVDVDEPGVENAPGLIVDAAGEQGLEEAATRERISATIDGIPDTLRIPLILRDVDGFSYQEIADQLGLGLSAVKMRIRRGREEFRQRFGERGGGNGTGGSS
jgi:RNA polymerase sigma-70 factor (ECF subfamily)